MNISKMDKPYKAMPELPRSNPSAPRMNCLTCGRRFYLDETSTPPFCCERCQLIDLGRWLGEEIGLPYEGDAGDAPVEYREAEEDDSQTDPG